ncbi:hypothetical protein GBA52_016292 [Prunus armeniaca]|nr:hypothetical protein GBA52_016292 [Prunus armeniaca]
MEKLLQSNFGVVLCLLQFALVHDTESTISLTQEQSLQELLHKFEVVFQPPTGLPPHRTHDHRIPLLEGCKPPSARIPPLQKTKIEKCVQES